MKPINANAHRILERLIAGLNEPGNARKIDNSRGTYMPVSVECIGPNLYSVCHYGEQNGDLMRDPEIVFWRGPDQRFYPTGYRNDYLGVDRIAITFDESGKPSRYYPREQRDEATFAGTWMRNIRQQQNLEV